MYLNHFTSFHDFGRFIWARQFVDTQTNSVIVSKNRCERLGDLLTAPLLTPIDIATRNMYDPKVIISAVMISLAAISIAYYPDKTIGVISKAIPKAVELAPSTLRFAMFCWMQISIIGLGLRTWGRLDPNSPLLQKWDANQVLSIPLGSPKV
jgi:hypothetical protein